MRPDSQKVNGGKRLGTSDVDYSIVDVQNQHTLFIMTIASTVQVIQSNPATGFTISSRLEMMFYTMNSEEPLINSYVVVKTVLITIILTVMVAIIVALIMIMAIITVMVSIIIIITMLLLVSKYKCRNYFSHFYTLICCGLF